MRVRVASTRLGRAGHWYARHLLGASRLGRRPLALPTTSWWVWAATAGLTLAAGALRVRFIDHPMRYDESWTYFEYATRSPLFVVSHYMPNNHILHTLLMWGTLKLLGNQPALLRLPAFLAGTALVPLAVMLGRAVSRRAGWALLAGAAVAASTLLVDYSTNARGYTLFCALTLALCWCTIRLTDTPGWRRGWLWWALLGAAGAYTLPTMLFPVAGLTILLTADALRHRRRRRNLQLCRLAAALATCGILTGLLYLPVMVVTGPSGLAGAREIIRDFSEQTFGSNWTTLGCVLEHWTLDLHPAVLVLAAVGLLGSAAQAWRTSRSAWALPWFLLAGGVLVAAVLPMPTYPRVWIYLLPVVLTSAVCGLSVLPGAALRRAAGVALGIGLVISAGDTLRRDCLVAEDPHTLVDAELIARAVADRPSRRFALLAKPSTPALRYYANLYDLPRSGHPSTPDVEEVFLVVNHTQSLAEVLESKRSVLESFGPPEPYRTLPHATMYRLARIEPGEAPRSASVAAAGR